MNPFTPCRDCTRPMRPRRTLIATHPGTVQHQGLGLCVTCYWRARRENGPESAPSARDSAWIQAQRGHLAAWLAWRGRTDKELAA